MQGIMMKKRTQLLSRLRAALKMGPAVALLGPRQCGKTTLARQLAELDAL
jgi:predicted AAA+ superfamily ATPase